MAEDGVAAAYSGAAGSNAGFRLEPTFAQKLRGPVPPWPGLHRRSLRGRRRRRHLRPRPPGRRPQAVRLWRRQVAARHGEIHRAQEHLDPVSVAVGSAGSRFFSRLPSTQGEFVPLPWRFRPETVLEAGRSGRRPSPDPIPDRASGRKARQHLLAGRRRSPLAGFATSRI